MRSHLTRSAFLFLAALCATYATAQEVTPDTVLKLRTGMEVRGKLVEVKNGVYVLTLPDGRTVLHPTADVESAERLAPERPASKGRGKALLAPGSRMFVKPVAEHDTHEVLGNYLRDWGRWKVVEKADEADIQIRLVLSGSPGWGRASIVAIIEDPIDGSELWKSQKQTGNRTIFHGYTSPLNRACEGITNQMKKASGGWPGEPTGEPHK